MPNNSWFGNLTNFFQMKPDEVEQTNYKYEDFKKVGEQDDQMQRLSVLDRAVQEANQNPVSFDYDSASFVDFIYGSVSTNKPIRLSNYRQMASFPEVSDAIEEICDSAVTLDENGNAVNLTINKRIQGMAIKEIQNSFDEYVSLFDFEANMFEYCMKFITDGELAWENLISKENQDYGIVGLNFIKPEAFEYAVNMKTEDTVGLMVFINSENGGVIDKGENQKKNYGTFTIEDLQNSDKIKDQKAVFLPWSQVTYICTGKFSSDGLICYPVLERARKAYNQLSLIEDAIIIYRLVRAPERLVFNVDTGTLPRARAEQEVQKMMKRYQTKKVYNPTTGTITNSYDPHNMLESYWFVKPAGSEGTSVETLQGGMSLGELDDLHYFLRKLYISLKVPFNRYSEPTINIDRVDSINYEEYRFAKFIMRIQNCFASGLLDGFKTHLKLKGLWAQHKLRDADLRVRFTPPTTFEIYEQQRLLEIKIANYEAFSSAMQEMNTYAMQKYLNLSDEDIAYVWKKKEEDAIKQAMIEWKVAQIEDHGSPEPVFDEDDSGGGGW